MTPAATTRGVNGWAPALVLSFGVAIAGSVAYITKERTTAIAALEVKMAERFSMTQSYTERELVHLRERLSAVETAQPLLRQQMAVLVNKLDEILARLPK